MSTVKENIKYLRTFSVTLAAALELLGYSYKAIKERQHFFTKFPNYISCDNFIAVGSKAEGTATLDESDYDFMTIADRFLCADDISLYNDANIVLFLTKIDNLNPGYSKLKFAFPDEVRHLSDKGNCIVEQGDDVYLSSVLFKDRLTHELLGIGDEIVISGPSTRVTTPGRGEYDDVLAIPYRYSKISQEWLNRPRFHGWPSQKHLMDLKKLDWHLVPVGPQKDSILEWRICFTLGEQYLVKTFNITQIHLLILLKKIMNKSLKPLCKAFSSYTAKNLVFWMTEILAPENFKVEDLSSLLMISLQMMRAAVENEHLQNYMIPSRNLFKEKFSREKKDTIITLLDRFIDYGPGFLTKWSEFSDLKAAMQNVNTNTDLAQQLHERDEHEKEELSLWTVISLEYVPSNDEGSGGK